MELRLVQIFVLLIAACHAQDFNDSNQTGPTTTRTTFTYTTTYVTTTFTTTLGAFSATVTTQITLAVADPASFVADPEAVTGVRRAIAAAAGVHEMAVEVTLSVGSRRLAANQRRLSGSVVIDATITTQGTTETAANALGSSVISSIASVTTSALASSINTQISAAGGGTYTATVTTFNRPSGYVVATSVPPPGSVTGDPITQYGDKKVKFLLPYGRLTLMVQSPHMKVFAAPHPGEEGDEQWLNQVSITDAAGLQLLQVNIKSDIAVFNRSRIPKDAFETMDVKLGPMLEPLQIMPGSQTIMNFGEKVHVTFGRVRSPHAHPEAPRREVIIVAAPYLHVAITSASGREWYGINSPLSTKHGHLDLMFPAFNARKLTGLLPELWDLQPISEASRSMVLEDAEEEDEYGEVNATAGMQESEMSEEAAPDMISSGHCDEKLLACHV